MKEVVVVELEGLPPWEQPRAKIVETKPRKTVHTGDAELVVKVEAMTVLPT